MYYVYYFVNGERVIADEKSSSKDFYHVEDPFIIERDHENSVWKIERCGQSSSFRKLHVAQRFLPQFDELSVYLNAKNGLFENQFLNS